MRISLTVIGLSIRLTQQVDIECPGSRFDYIDNFRQRARDPPAIEGVAVRKIDRGDSLRIIDAGCLDEPDDGRAGAGPFWQCIPLQTP